MPEYEYGPDAGTRGRRLASRSSWIKNTKTEYAYSQVDYSYVYINFFVSHTGRCDRNETREYKDILEF